MDRPSYSICSRLFTAATHHIQKRSERLHAKRHPKAAIWAIALATCGALTAPVMAHAQSAVILGFQSTIPTTGLGLPAAVAVDANGDIFIADSTNNQILEEKLSNGVYTQSIVVTGLNQPSGIAVDAGGDLYISDYGSNSVFKETPGAGGYTQTLVDGSVAGPAGIAVDANSDVYVASSTGNKIIEDTPSSGTTYTQTVIPTSTLSNPRGVAVDGSSDVFIADTGNNRLLKETLSGGSYTESTIGSGLSQPSGIALGTNGYLYIADSGSNQIIDEYDSAGTYIQAIATTVNLNSPMDVAVDSSGAFYVVDQGNNRIVEETKTATFQATQVGSPSQPVTAIFDFSFAGTGVKPQVVADGITGLDFSAAGTGTCATNGTSYSYSAGNTCTVNIIFKPAYPGVRYGAVQLLNSSGSAFATAYIQGTGTGPIVNFTPSAVNPLSISGLTSPYAIASDSAGNLYITIASSAYASGNNLVKETWNGSSWTQSTIATGFAYPVGVGIDGAGNVYVADEMGTIYKETPSGGTYTQSTVDSNVGTLTTLAVDHTGNVYVSSDAYGLVEEALLSNGTYQRETFPNRVYAGGLAVDANGDLFVTDNMTNALYEFVNANGALTQKTIASSLNFPLGITVDGFGNVYFADSGTIYKETPSSGGYVKSLATSSVSTAGFLAIDGLGNIYFTGNRQPSSLSEIDVSDPPTLTFKSTPFNATSTDSPQTVTVLNAGNAALHFPVQSTNNNPYATQSFTLAGNSASDCPVAIAGSANPTSLAAGSSCDLSVSFTPQQVGAISGSVVLTDDAPHQASASYATQSITLSGTGTQAIPPASWSTPAPIPYGSALSATQLDATSTVAGTFTYSPTAGTILKAGTHTLTATFTPTDTIDYTTATATVTLTVNQATPAITWPTPATITYGTALSSTQLDASSTVAGTFTYSPAAGAILKAGTHTLTATFTPTDTTDYTTATATVTLTVNQATPAITWPTPASIAAGTPLSSTQLDATASVPGSFAYTPPAGTVLAVGSQTLKTTFTPTDTTDYTTATASVTLAVVNPVPVISSISPAIADAGGSAFTITVNGGGFEPGSTIFLGSTSLTTTEVSGSQLSAQIPSSAIASAGTLAITVQTPSPGGGTSNTAELEVDSAGSSVTAPTSSPTTITVNPGSPAVYTVTLPSTASNVSATCLNLPAGATCAYSASANTVTIKTSASTPAGTYQVTIVFTETIPTSTAAALSLPLFLLPFAAGIRNRHGWKKAWMTIGFAVALSAASLFVSGCGGKGYSSSGSQTTQQTQTVTSSTMITLKVQ